MCSGWRFSIKASSEALRSIEAKPKCCLSARDFPSRRSNDGARQSKRRHNVIPSGKPLELGDYRPARPAVQTAPIKTMVLIGALVVYALGFVALYPLAQASVSKSVAEGNDPALVGLAGP
jgi:hypothetical protein